MPATIKNYPVNKKGSATAKMPPLADGVTPQRAVGEELTLKMVRDQIPAKYFKQHTMKGFYYVARDCAQLAVAAYLMSQHLLPACAGLTAAVGSGAFTFVAYALLWNAFWFVQGATMTGLWVLAHECGHRAFSPSTMVNDVVGWVLHSALLVPYHSWRISHGTHHKKTNHLTEDTVFIPECETAEKSKLREAFDEAPLVSVAWMVIMLTVGWPGYLLWNAAGQPTKGTCSHFNPSSPIFRGHQRLDVIISDIGFALMLAFLAFCTYSFGLANVMCWYGMPYLWTNHWLVMITFLQHTDVRLPHYDADEWTFLRGAIAAVDRNYGAVLNWTFHNINNSHVVHHAFSTMPFYHAIEVTEKYVPKILGDLYITDSRPVYEMAMESWRSCRYVVPEEGVTYFRQ